MKKECSAEKLSLEKRMEVLRWIRELLAIYAEDMNNAKRERIVTVLAGMDIEKIFFVHLVLLSCVVVDYDCEGKEQAAAKRSLRNLIEKAAINARMSDLLAASSLLKLGEKLQDLELNVEEILERYLCISSSEENAAIISILVLMFSSQLSMNKERLGDKRPDILSDGVKIWSALKPIFAQYVGLAKQLMLLEEELTTKA